MKFDEVTLNLKTVKERRVIQEEQPRNSKDLSGERSVRRILGARQVHSHCEQKSANTNQICLILVLF